MMMADNSISTLAKIIIFQKDGNLVTHNLTLNMLNALPLKTDTDEAQSAHTLILTHTLEKNASLMQHADALKNAILRIKQQSEENPEEDILGDKGKPLLQQVVS